MIGRSILLVGAHSDDVEMNAGGSVHKWRGQGRNVSVAILAADEAHVRHAESLAACMHLDVDRVYADTHQDHVSAYKIMAAAARKVPNFLMFKPTYPSGRTEIPFQPNVVSMLSAKDIDAKVQALDAFMSQRVKYGGENWGKAMHAVAQGDAWTYAGVHGYAEVFQLGRLRI